MIIAVTFISIVGATAFLTWCAANAIASNPYALPCRIKEERNSIQQKNNHEL